MIALNCNKIKNVQNSPWTYFVDLMHPRYGRTSPATNPQPRPAYIQDFPGRFTSTAMGSSDKRLQRTIGQVYVVLRHASHS